VAVEYMEEVVAWVEAVSEVLEAVAVGPTQEAVDLEAAVVYTEEAVA
jgi:hypothetical protein